MRRRVDANQREIVAALRQIGASVWITSSLGGGFPDLAVGHRGRTYLLEVKVPPIRLTPDEEGFHLQWRGQVAIVTNVEEAMEVLNEA